MVLTMVLPICFCKERVYRQENKPVRPRETVQSPAKGKNTLIVILVNYTCTCMFWKNYEMKHFSVVSGYICRIFCSLWTKTTMLSHKYHFTKHAVTMNKFTQCSIAPLHKMTQHTFAFTQLHTTSCCIDITSYWVMLHCHSTQHVVALIQLHTSYSYAC